MALIWAARAGRRLIERREAQEGFAHARSSVALPAHDHVGVEQGAAVTAGNVVIGMDPHKRSATIEVMSSDETVLGGGR